MLVLTVTQGPDAGTDFDFPDESRVIIGRGSPQFKLADRMVSHAHARIKLIDGKWFIRDIKSRNGTFLNGKRVVTDTQVTEGDEIKVGFTVMKIQIKAAPVDAVGLGDTEFDAIEALGILPDESRKFETIESLISIPEEESAEEQSDDVVVTPDDEMTPEELEAIFGGADDEETDESAADESGPVSVPNEAKSSPDVEAPVETTVESPAETLPETEPDSKRSPMTIGESAEPPKAELPKENQQPKASPSKVTGKQVFDASHNELMGVLAFDQVAEMARQQDYNAGATTSPDASPAAYSKQKHGKVAGRNAESDTEAAANDWASLVESTLSSSEGNAWEDEDGATPLGSIGASNQPHVKKILDDLAKEESSADDTPETRSEDNDESFAEYIKQQQELAEKEAAIQCAAASHDS